MAGLYVHIPFCSQRCVYCDFYFVTTQKSHTSFVQALCLEIEHYGLSHGKKEPVETIYFGGGTPSLLHEDEIQRILQTIHAHFDTSGLVETTLELNPEDVDPDYLAGLRALGIDRLSIGIQSFFASDLAFMNRSHTAEQAEAIVPLAREAGFENITADLIFGLPEQPEEYWAANLEKMVGLGVPHLSTYSLTVEERTPLYKQVESGLVVPPEDDVLADQYRFTMDYLEGRGYEHYEVSSFAKPGFRSRHNQTYWQHKNYLGFGPSAHSFWWRTGSAAERWSNVRNLRQYEALLNTRQLPLDARETIGLDTLADEYVMLRLRTTDGLDLDVMEHRYGVDLLVERTDELAWMEGEGYIHPIRNGAVRLTDAGMLLCDALTGELLAD
ncbi:MAG TPA: radical SAM family heme chaperone HemW [Rhodothermales bacterium]|nr:radical SAM family heme chaperone HemW [Rhodothermales bacterium]